MTAAWWAAAFSAFVAAFRPPYGRHRVHQAGALQLRKAG